MVADLIPTDGFPDGVVVVDDAGEIWFPCLDGRYCGITSHTSDSGEMAMRRSTTVVVITNQTAVACTPDELFDYCVDIRNEVEWNPTAVSTADDTAG